jgi:hypothetical protein
MLTTTTSPFNKSRSIRPQSFRNRGIAATRIHTRKSSFLFNGSVAANCPPPTKLLPLLFAKFEGRIDPLNFGISDFHAMFVLFTSTATLLTTKLYESLNKLHAINPHGKMTPPSDVTSSGAHVEEMSVDFTDNPKSWLSLRLFTYLGHHKSPE